MRPLLFYFRWSFSPCLCKMDTMAKNPDPQALNAAVIRVVEDAFTQLCHAAFSAEPVVVEKDIIEYDGRMRLSPMEKFNAPAYVAAVNYHLSEQHLQAHDVAGTFILYVKEDMVEKLFKAFGQPASASEDEAKCLDAVGRLCDILAGDLKNKIAGLGLAELAVSAPVKYKNAVPGGVPFDYNLFKEQELSFSFWKEKCIVIEVCLGDIPARGR